LKTSKIVSFASLVSGKKNKIEIKELPIPIIEKTLQEAMKEPIKN